MTEYDTAHCSEFIKSKDFILSKWLQSILVQTDQENLKSRLQLIGGPGAGKQTVMFYFDKDHPKVPSVMIPGGSKRFKDRFDLYSPTHLVPVNMSQENCAILNDSYHKPLLSTSQSEFETISSGYPFFRQFSAQLGLYCRRPDEKLGLIVKN